MVIKGLGQTRTKLLESIKDLTDEQVNQKPSAEKWSIAQVLYHLYTTEKNTADFILNSLESKKSSTAENKDMSFIADRSKKVKASEEPPTDFFTKKELIDLLNKSRFEHLQNVFNETHVDKLEEKSVDHPGFGEINLKNLVEFIYLHEQRHLEQIAEIKQELFSK